jgi:hypothetical protein
MDTRDVKAEFAGFGPITSSKTTFAQGVGLGSSFAPVWTTEPKLQPKTIATSVSLNDYPFMLQPKQQEFAYVVKLNYGEVAGVAPDGLTREEDYILTPPEGENYVYLIITFDGDGLITDRTIEYGEEVPDDTDDVKHMVIGKVISEGSLFPYSVYQNISQDVYTEKATFIENDTIPSHLFADPRKIHLTNIDETFVADIDGTETISKLYLENAEETEYIELKKDSAAGEVVVGGYAGTEAQNFILSSNDTDGVSKLVLYDTGSANYLESKVDTGAKKTSVYGYADNEICNFELIADNTAQKSNVSVFGQNSNVYASMATEVEKASVYGYSGNEAQNFVLSSDNTEDKSSLALFDTGSQNYIEIKEENDVASVYGYMNNQNHNFLLKAQSGQSFLQLFNQANDAYVELKQANSETSLYGYIGSGGEYFLLRATSGDTKLYLEAHDDNATMKTTGIAFTDTNNTRNSALSETGLLIAKPNGQTTITESSITIEEQPNSGPNVYINIPTAGGSTVSASWKEIDVCVGGVAKKMQVLATDPYDPPTP